jgi:hypothetical protein
LGSGYLSTVREIYSGVLSAREPTRGRVEGSHPHLIGALARAEEQLGAHLQTADLAGALAAALNELWSKEHQASEASRPVVSVLFKAQVLASRIDDDTNLALDPDLDTYYLQSIVVRRLPTFLGSTCNGG